MNPVFSSRNKLQDLRNMLKRNTETRCSLTGAIIVLGCGALVLNFTYIINDIYCLALLMDRKPTVSEALSPISYTLFSFSVVLQMAFFNFYNGARFVSRPMLHYALAVWIAADWWDWFAMTATPLLNSEPDYIANSTNGSPANETYYMCGNKPTELFRFVKVLETYLKPMNIEYRTVSISVLFQLWGTMTNVDVKGQNLSVVFILDNTPKTLVLRFFQKATVTTNN